MRSSFWYSVSLLFLLGGITGCTHQQKTVENEISFDTISVSRNYHLENDSTLPSCNIKIKYVYPESYSDKVILGDIQRIFLSTFFEEDNQSLKPEEMIEEYVNKYINNYQEDAKNFFSEDRYEHDSDRNDKYFSYYEQLSNWITFNKDNLLSFQVIRINYKGGENSIRQYLNYVIDLSTGKLLKEEDVFLQEYEKVLHAIFLEKLRTGNKNMSISELEDLGYFGLEEIAPNENFLVDQNGLTYIFNKGEYSILQMDEIKIYIPYSEVIGLLKKDSPLSVFYK